MADSHNGHTNGHTNGHAGHSGHGGVRFEPTDVNTTPLYVFGMVLTLIVSVAFVSMWFLYVFLNLETKQQNEGLSRLIRENAKLSRPGERLPYDGGKNGPILEGIQGTDPQAFRSGVMGYPTMSGALKKAAAERLDSYGYIDKEHGVAHIPVSVAIAELKDKLPVREKGKGDETPIGSVTDPYSFWPSTASAGRKPIGETKP